MSVPENLLEIREYTGDGYKPVVYFEKWRVAYLNSLNEAPPENVNEMEKHTETDEVFILLDGKAILFLGEGNEDVTKIHAADMEPFKIYNVKKSVWHTITMSEGTRILIVENSDTASHNSAYYKLSEKQKKTIIDLTKKLWQK
jgi:ureidoglycolate hydrolase